MWKEFKNFILTGNVIDFAVAVILAGAVGLVVNGFVNDIVMPVVGHFAGGMDFSSLKVVLADAVVATDGTVTIDLDLSPAGNPISLSIDRIEIDWAD